MSTDSSVNNMNTPEVPDWTKLWSAIQGIQQDLSAVRKDVSDIKESYSTLEDSVNEAKATAENAMKRSEMLEACVRKLSDENVQLKDKLLSQEAYSKKYNLNFFNISEEKDETPDILRHKVSEVLKAMDLDLSRMYIDNIHRLPQGDRKPRPIIVKFVSFLDRSLVWKNKYKLFERNTGYFIQDHYPAEIEQNIRKLLPIMKAAKLKKMNAKLECDKLVINSSTFTVNTLHLLPDCLKGVNSAVRKEEDHLLFFSGLCPLSNFFPSVFKVGTTEYSHGEQFIQKMKADLFRDSETGKAIMRAKTPQQMKSLGNKVKGFSEDQWRRQAVDLVIPGLEAKFTQNEECKQYLLNTGDTFLAEASRDDFWAIGCGFFDRKAMEKKDTWTSNHLGHMLMRIRQQLIEI